MKLDLRGGEGTGTPAPTLGAAPNACKYSYQLGRSRVVHALASFASLICGARTVPRSPLLSKRRHRGGETGGLWS